MIGNVAQTRGGMAANVALHPFSRRHGAGADIADRVDANGPCTLEVAIIGDGKHGLAVGATLAARGHNVRVWMPQGAAPHSHEIAGCKDGVEGCNQALYFSRVERDLRSAVEGAEILVVSGRSSGYPVLAGQLAKLLTIGQTILMPDAPLCASLQFACELERAGAERQVNIGEMGKLFSSVSLDGDSLMFSEVREKVSVCGRTRNETRRVLAAGSKLWSGLVPASNVLERGLADVERFLNPVLWLFHAVGFQSHGLPISPMASSSLVSVVSRLADEVNALAASCSVGLIGVEQVLRDYAGLKASSLPQAVSEMAEQLFAHQQGRPTSAVEIAEILAADIAETHVALSNLAMVARVPVPMIDSVIEVAACATHRELRKEGRGLHQLGLVGLDITEIVETVNS